MTFVLNHAELQPINGEVFTSSSSNIQDGTRLDIANGFWGGRFECTFFGVQVFNPHAPSNRNSHRYRKHKYYWRRNVSTSSEWERRNMLPLHLLFCQLQVVWPTKILCSTRGSPPAWQQNRINFIASSTLFWLLKLADWSWYSPARRTKKSSTLTMFILAILHCFSTKNRLPITNLWGAVCVKT